MRDTKLRLWSQRLVATPLQELMYVLYVDELTTHARGGPCGQAQIEKFSSLSFAHKGGPGVRSLEPFQISLPNNVYCSTLFGCKTRRSPSSHMASSPFT